MSLNNPKRIDRRWARSFFVSLTASGSLVAPVAGAVGFKDDTAVSGLVFSHRTSVREADLFEFHRMTPGVGVADVDGDGDMDVFVAGGTDQNSALFINDGTGVFSDCTAAWGIDTTGVEGSSVSFADVDHDGDPDLYLGTYDAPDQLWMNDGASFVESGSLVTTENFKTFGAGFGDYDGDGHLDLACADWLPFPPPGGNRLFKGDGTGSFNDVTDSSGTFQVFSQPFTPIFADMDGDRMPELLATGDFETSRYYENISVDAGAPFLLRDDTGTGTDENGMGSALGDYDGDGDLDWFVTSIWREEDSPKLVGSSGNRLYRNDGNHQFTDVTDHAGVRQGDWGWGCVFADFDHNGWLDIAMVNGFAVQPDFTMDPTRLWMHKGNPDVSPVFSEEAVASGLDDTTDGKGLVSFDADLDGDLDLLITVTHGPMRFFRNTTVHDPATWLQVDLVPPDGDAPDGIGAKLVVVANGQEIHRECMHALSFMSSLPYRVHFGFPTAPEVELRVTWRNGFRSVYPSVASDQLLTVRFADLNLDGEVGFQDLVALLSDWGVCGEPSGCAADLDASGSTGFEDLLLVLAHWSP